MFFIDPILVKLHCCSNKNKASSSSCIKSFYTCNMFFFLHAVLVILITIARYLCSNMLPVALAVQLATC